MVKAEFKERKEEPHPSAEPHKSREPGSGPAVVRVVPAASATVTKSSVPDPVTPVALGPSILITESSMFDPVAKVAEAEGRVREGKPHVSAKPRNNEIGRKPAVVEDAPAPSVTATVTESSVAAPLPQVAP